MSGLRYQEQKIPSLLTRHLTPDTRLINYEIRIKFTASQILSNGIDTTKTQLLSLLVASDVDYFRREVPPRLFKPK